MVFHGSVEHWAAITVTEGQQGRCLKVRLCKTIEIKCSPFAEATWLEHIGRDSQHNKVEWITGCTHICVIFASRWRLLSFLPAFSLRISVIVTETACNRKLCTKTIVREKLWITVIIKLDWCHWLTTAGRCFYWLLALTVSVSACLLGRFSSLGEQEMPVVCLPA